MASSKAELILHPTRMRIMLALAGQKMSPQQLGAALPDIAQATLYRHVNKLAQAGLLTVVEERQVRGTTEKVYTLNETGAVLSPDDVADFSKDDHMQAFTVFVAKLLGDFARYLQSREKPDLVADGVSYSQMPLYLSDEEFSALGAAMNEVVAPIVSQNAPAPGRRRRIFSTIVMPDVDAPATKEQE